MEIEYKTFKYLIGGGIILLAATTISFCTYQTIRLNNAIQNYAEQQRKENTFREEKLKKFRDDRIRSLNRMEEFLKPREIIKEDWSNTGKDITNSI